MRYGERIQRLKDKLLGQKLDGLIVTNLKNILYLSGFEGEDAVLLVNAEGPNFLITDPRFTEEAADPSGFFKAVISRHSRHTSLAHILRRHRIKRVGFESDWLSFSDYNEYARSVTRSSLIPTRQLIENQRMLKDSDEIRLIAKSASIARKAYLYAKTRLTPRMSGQELAILLDNSMRRFGAAGPAFPTIAAKNPHSSRPHAKGTKEAFGRDAAVVIDMGAVYESYTSDLTRVLFLGKIPTQLRHIYNILLAAQRLAIEKIRPGIKASSLDQAARRYIASKGYEKYFLHSLGHGIGLEVHESPRIAASAKMPLEAAMVFTVEPGIYIPNVGGLRIEDIVVVTKNGYEVLTDDIPK